jgi:serine/threonine protein kinase
MGVVYLARGRRARQVAIKVPRADLARDPAFRERFRREAQAASAVAARCTAGVLEIAADGKRPYIVTEYVDGPTLHAAVTADGPLVGSDLAAFAVGVAEALAALHTAGVTHRDLTPGNVVLGRWGPKVIDFGIARADDASTLTQTGIRIGTPAWMAPEQARGQRVTSAADTFSWGTLVAFAGTGRHPFGGGRTDAVIYRIVHEQPDLLGLEPTLTPLVERALAKDPSARPAPAELLAAITPIEAALERASAGAATAAPESIATVPSTATRVLTAPPTESRRRVPSTPSPSWVSSRRRRWPRALALTALVLVAGSALGAGIAFFLDRDDDPGAAPGPGAASTAPSTTTTTTTTTTEPPRSLTAYCASVETYYARLDEFDAQFNVFPFPFPLFPPDDEEFEAALVEFASENRQLFADLRDQAPLEIADDVAVVTDAYATAAEGDVDAIDTAGFVEAESRMLDFDETECGIDRGFF